jgi:asparagine synthetase B (glutamine-hydrolysing)
VYWAVREQRIHVGLDPWLVSHATGPPLPDDDALADMLYAPVLPASSTSSLLARVQRWTPTPYPPPALAGRRSLEDGATRVDRALRTAVQSAWQGHQRACVLVTGGLDSAVVAGIVAEVTGRPPLLVAIRAGMSSERELRAQDVLARHLEAELITIEELPEFTIQPLLRRNANSDFPSGGVFTHIWDAAASHAKTAGADLIFTGEGGNEVFGATLASARDQLRAGAFLAALATLGRLRDTDDPNAIGLLIRHPKVSERTLAASLVSEWRGRHVTSAGPASRRRALQIRRMRQSGYSFAEIDTRLSLERADLFNAHTTAVRVPFAAPLQHAEVVAAVTSVHPALRNPVNVGVQDKYLLRLVGRRYLPGAISELRKVGLSNQVSLAVRGSDVGAQLKQIESGARWAGLRLTASFADPRRLPADVGLDWTRMLAIAAWATQGLDR